MQEFPYKQLALKRIESYMRVSLYFGPDITGVYPVLVAICEPVFVAVSEVGWGTYANYRWYTFHFKINSGWSLRNLNCWTIHWAVQESSSEQTLLLQRRMNRRRVGPLKVWIVYSMLWSSLEDGSLQAFGSTPFLKNQGTLHWAWNDNFAYVSVATGYVGVCSNT